MPPILENTDTEEDAKVAFMMVAPDLDAPRRHRHRRHNLGAHKVAGLQRAIQAAGATRW